MTYHAKSKVHQFFKNRLRGMIPHGWMAKFVNGKLHWRRLSDGFEVLAENNVKRQLIALGYRVKLNQIGSGDTPSPVLGERSLVSVVAARIQSAN